MFVSSDWDANAINTVHLGQQLAQKKPGPFWSHVPHGRIKQDTPWALSRGVKRHEHAPE